MASTETRQLDQIRSGAVVAVRGSVVDAEFPHQLPAVNSELRTGRDGEVVVEVLSQLDEETVRGIALTSTGGLSRGSSISHTGHSLRVPVGQALLGRMFNVFGQVIDREAAPQDVRLRSIHRPSPSLAERAADADIFETGTKAIDLLAPLERGGKAGLFGGRRSGQDCPDHRVDQQCRGSARWRKPVLWHR
jgi:F-type H+-transporting ATPase subunit beta